MARRRPHLRRWGLLLLVALLVALLLEWNRFLPGVWPGGGGETGSRRTPTGAREDPRRVVPSPPRSVLPPAPAAAPLVVVVAPPAGTDEAVRVDLVAGGAVRTETARDGAARFDAPPRRPDALVVTSGERRLVHGTPAPAVGRELRVAWPQAPLAATASSPANALEIHVEDATGRPLPGADVAWTAGGREGHLTTDARGKARLDAPPATHVRLCAVATGHGETCAYASAFAPTPTRVRLFPVVRRATTFVDPATGQPLPPTTLRLVSARGSVRTISRPEDGSPRFEASLPADQDEGSFLEVEVPGRPTARFRWASLGPQTPVPAGRETLVNVVSAAGAPVANASVTARYAPGVDPEDAEGAVLRTTTRTDEHGRARLAVPDDRPVDLLVVPREEAPASRRLAIDDPGPTRVEVGPGSPLRVVVRDPSGAPLARARVLAHSRAGDAVAPREARTDAAGRAVLPGLSAGRVEVFAHAPGRAWAWTVAQAGPDAPEVALVLEPGRRLLLVVEDPWGRPLEGVHVRSAPRPSVGGQAPAPADPEGAPWRTDGEGILEALDQPPGRLDLFLHLDGYEDEVVRGVEPGDAAWYATLVPQGR